MGGNLNSAKNKMDFTQLSNEQLLDLLKELMAESIHRNITTAAREVLLTEKEKAEIRDSAERRAKEKAKQDEISRIEKDAYEKEQQRLRSEKENSEIKKMNDLWMIKKQQAEQIENALIPANRSTYWINVWGSGSEKRVYINDGEPFGKRTKEVACLFVTGNSRKAPGALDLDESYLNGTSCADFKQLLTSISNKWASVKFNTIEARNYEPAN